MKPSAIKKSLDIAISAKRPVFLWGSPGIGKSDIVKQIAQEKDLKLIDIRAILLDPVDLRGIPTVQNDFTSWAIPDFLPKDGKGILFLDELNAAPQSVQAACYQLILDRKLGDYILPDGWTIIAAGNLETDRAVTNRMPSPLSNRFIHLFFEVDTEDWVRWALKNNIRTEVISFIRFRPVLLHNFDPTTNDKAFPTPRSWEFVSQILDQSPDKDIEFELIKGTIGEGTTAEFIPYTRIFRDLPSRDDILMNPSNASIPDDPATLYAVTGSLANIASEQNFNNLVIYFNRLPSEFSVLAVRDSKNHCRDIVNTRAYIEWTSEHQDVLI